MKDYSNVICITNRHLIRSDYMTQMEKVFQMHPKAVVVREKDLKEEEYFEVLQKLLQLGEKYGVTVIPNTFYKAALKLNCKAIHLPLPLYKELSKTQEGKRILSQFAEIGTSVHSLEDLKMAEKLNAEYVFAGHIFATDCKKGVPPRGISFLKEICEHTDLRVYAIGGIKEDNKEQCLAVGATGVCMMSAFAK